MSELIEKEKVLKHVQWMTTQAQLYREIDKIPTFEQPTLNPNQQIVLEWLEEDESQSFKEALGDFYFYVYHGYSISEAYEQLSEKEFAQVLEVFARRAQEQEEE